MTSYISASGVDGVDGSVAGERAVDEVDPHRSGQRLVDAAEELDVSGVDGTLDLAVLACRRADPGEGIVMTAGERGGDDERGGGHGRGRDSEDDDRGAAHVSPPPSSG